MKLILTKSEIYSARDPKQYINDRLIDAGFDLSKDISVEQAVSTQCYIFLQGGEDDAERADSASTQENTG